MSAPVVTREQVAELKAFSIALDINRGGVRDGVIPIKTAKAIKDATAAAEAYLAQQQELERLRDNWRWLRSEIDCRIDHGADSRGHLEGIAGLMDRRAALESEANRG